MIGDTRLIGLKNVRGRRNTEKEKLQRVKVTNYFHPLENALKESDLQLFEQHLSSQAIEQQQFHNLGFEEMSQCLQNKMPFFQMSPFTAEPHLQLLLSTLQHHHNSRFQAVEIESCVTHESPPDKQHYLSPGPEVVSQADSPENQVSSKAVAPLNGRERRKRKRSSSRPSKNKEEVENQRMTHITVERNRRRQMNDHLDALRSLMPPSFIQRGDQASIIGGAIDFVKELEQLLQSLEAQKKMRIREEEGDYDGKFDPFDLCPQYTRNNNMLDSEKEEGMCDGVEAENIQVIVIQTHVNLKVLSTRRPGQLLRVISALENLRLTILHLNITSMQSSVLYSFNLKIEDECKLGSADDIAAAVHQVFSFIDNARKAQGKNTTEEEEEELHAPIL
ncbi:hypothetical protein GIB67_001654 [Kingdonia uniflora]|uniref:BHLH domain-containing protein n=1 Tax=Kingdonia uniflora TaxID=39325 RepID=A0A7J7L0V0_9MAGN|nr:hypothetical protein GIB67_001654 [Kingdonia uniflora]